MSVKCIACTNMVLPKHNDGLKILFFVHQQIIVVGIQDEGLWFNIVGGHF